MVKGRVSWAQGIVNGHRSLLQGRNDMGVALYIWGRGGGMAIASAPGPCDNAHGHPALEGTILMSANSDTLAATLLLLVETISKDEPCAAESPAHPFYARELKHALLHGMLGIETWKAMDEKGVWQCIQDNGAGTIAWVRQQPDSDRRMRYLSFFLKVVEFASIADVLEAMPKLSLWKQTCIAELKDLYEDCPHSMAWEDVLAVTGMEA